jgi:hypothetical protein
MLVITFHNLCKIVKQQNRDVKDSEFLVHIKLYANAVSFHLC